MTESVGFVSTRFAGTDGVSLESAKWAEVLWADDSHVSYWYGGLLDRAPEISMCIPEAFFHHPENAWINQRLWGHRHRPAGVASRIQEMADYLKGTLYEFVARFDISVLIVQNAVTIPMHVPLGVAITEFLLETEIPAIAHHHDFYWERSRFQNSAALDYLEMAFPPRVPRLQHVVINQAAREDLAWRKGIGSVLIPNVLDFDTPPPPLDDYNRDVREQIGLAPDDIFVLQPTRIVPRKGIEHAIMLLRRLGNPRCKLVISHDAGDEGKDYLRQIQELAQDENVELRLISDRVSEVRQYDGQGRKMYVLEDLYPHADFVTFPSLYEGFGNALLEAIYFRKPVLVNRYDVFARDIQPKGFRLPVIDGFINRQAVEEVRRLIEDAEYREEVTAYNYRLAQRYYGYSVLRYSLQSLFNNIRHLTE
ncbi:MAG TPA: glycosyltransferase [Chromatiales bacterium]|nr:glycosyltransferase [Chromatiales bacterium]